jgi:hypothetical protein
LSTACVQCPKALVHFSKVSLSTTALNLCYVALCVDSNVHDIRYFHELKHKGVEHFYATPDDTCNICTKYDILRVPFYFTLDSTGNIHHDGKELLAAVHTFASENLQTYAKGYPIWKTLHEQKEEESIIPCDPLLMPSTNHFVLYPIQNAEIWAF